MGYILLIQGGFYAVLRASANHPGILIHLGGMQPCIVLYRILPVI